MDCLLSEHVMALHAGKKRWAISFYRLKKATQKRLITNYLNASYVCFLRSALGIATARRRSRQVQRCVKSLLKDMSQVMYIKHNEQYFIRISKHREMGWKNARPSLVTEPISRCL